MLLRISGALLLAVPSCLAQSSTASASATQTLEPCGQVSSLLASYAEASPSGMSFAERPRSIFTDARSATISAHINIELAQACYDSVSLDQDDATNLIDGLVAVLEFQSDLEYLIDPPSGYLLAGVDLRGDLSDLRDQVVSNNVTGEIDFETRVTTILAQAHDGHLTYNLDGMSIFRPHRQIGSLVSVSLDGTDTPKVYLYSKSMKC